MIFFFCPDLALRSGGIRRLYRHVEILVQHDFPAAVLHVKPGFVAPDTPSVPIRYAEQPGTINAGDIVVIPEGVTNLMEMLADKPVRRFVIALSWAYVYPNLADGIDWRSYGIERVLCVSPFVRDFVSWSMRLPADVLDFSVDPQLFHYDPEQKLPRIAYFERKANGIDALRRALRSRDPAFVERLEWKGLNDLSIEEYAGEVRRSSVFLALGMEEALNLSVWEAMAAGAIVAGYDGIGLKHVLCGEGREQNCVRADNGDYVTLARRLEPLLVDLLKEDLSRWRPVIDNARGLVAAHTPESEARSVVDFWRRVTVGVGDVLG